MGDVGNHEVRLHVKRGADVSLELYLLHSDLPKAFASPRNLQTIRE